MIELIEGKKHQIIKRDGSLETYNPEKMYQVLLWACDGSEALAKELLNDIDIKVYDKISISKLFDEVIETAANKITDMFPVWDSVARNLYLQKIYKEVWGMKRSEYPFYGEVLKKGVQYGVYNQKIVENLTDYEIEQLDKHLKSKNDFLFTFGGLNLFQQKNCKKYTKLKYLELPQHAMMRAAIQLHYRDENRLENIKEKYDMISNHYLVIPTPIYLNSLTPVFNPTSCVLIQPEDDSESLMDTARSMAIYSKNGSGLGLDISRIRSVGSVISKDGVSSGVVPFVQVFESVVKAWNQKCYSDDTEILTENGWKLFKDLGENEKVAQYTYNKSGRGFIDFTDYSNFYEYELTDEKMYNFYTKSGVIDHLVSQNHRMIKLIGPSGNLQIEYAKDIEYNSDNYMILSGESRVKNKPLDLWSKFLIAYQADGMRNKRMTGKISNNLKYRFGFHKQKKIAYMEKLLRDMIKSGYPIEYTKKVNKNGDKLKTIFCVKIPLDFKPELPKTFSWVKINKMSIQEIDEFFEELSKWDSSFNKSGDAFSYTTTDRKNIDIIQALAALSNRRTKVHLPKKQKDFYKQKYVISISRKNTYRSASVGNKAKTGNGVLKKEINYTGKIYCVEVPSGMLVVRRNNSVIISGNSARVGAAAVYYPWWHFQSPEIIMLKDAGGQDSERARSLKYSIKWNNYFTEALLNDEEVYLFDPKEVPDLIEAHGDEFRRIYDKYKEKADRGTIRKIKIPATELAFTYLKVYAETGNNYWMSVDNANKYRVANGFINQSNLCCEILLNTSPLKMKTSDIYSKDGKLIETREYEGEIGICNLSNINCISWDNFTEEEKDKFAFSLLLGMDNAIEYSDYNVKAGERFNRFHRALGIGITNYQNWLAAKKVKLSDPEAKRLTHEITESVAFYLTKNSIELAKIRGRYHYFNGSLWSKGKFQWELYQENFNNVAPHLNFDMKYDWDSLRADMIRYGVRFENLMAVAPGATSSLALSFTESCEPIRSLKINKEGTYTLPFLAPNLTQNRSYYEFAWDLDNKLLLDLAAIRQKFIDQSQSTNLYYRELNSATTLLSDILYAEKLGIKTLYYLNTMKAGDIEVCESCSA